jgi:23S rRNA (adenine2503-C2)-methyltransferase
VTQLKKDPRLLPGNRRAISSDKGISVEEEPALRGRGSLSPEEKGERPFLEGPGAEFVSSSGGLPVLKDLLPQEVKELFDSFGLKTYRSAQVLKWIYGRKALSFEEMTDVSKEDRAFLAQRCLIGELELLRRQVASDGTEKWLLGLEDGLTVETVIIWEEDHLTQCVSAQVGCSMGCKFCRTASLPARRNLRTWEIVEQVVMARRLIQNTPVRNVVFMGMGEPLANYEAVLRAVRIMLDPRALDISKRRITISTCGLVPELRRLGQESLGISIAVSLNATTDEQRNFLMPINRKYPLSELLRACRELPLAPRNRITFEYVLLKGVNDSLEDAKRLAKLLRGISCKVNLIPHNPYPGSPFERPSEEKILAFQRVLADSGYTAPIRWSHGQDILAACGQLAGDI